MARSTIGGTRVGAGHSTELERGAVPASRQLVDYWCPSDHCTAAPFAADIQPPPVWDCRTCGQPAVLERGRAEPAPTGGVPFRTPYEFLMMRRTPEEGELLLAEALANLPRVRSRRRT
jgi:RNA polymerase-binding protein